MQQTPQMMNMMPQFPPTNITTEQIQKYLDENKKLILAILDNQNLGKLAECAQYQAQLQKNLMYLAAIADAQPPAPAVPVPSQIPAHSAVQQGAHYMQHPQAAMGQQPSGFPSKIPMQFNPQQMQEQQLQHQQAIQGHLGMRPVVSNGMHGEVNRGGGFGIGPSTTSGVTDFSRTGAGVSASVGGTPGAGGGDGASGGGASSNPTDARVGKQDGKEASSSDAQWNTAAGNSSANGEPANKKGSEDA